MTIHAFKELALSLSVVAIVVPQLTAGRAADGGAVTTATWAWVL
jgi:hypothetical protein